MAAREDGQPYWDSFARSHTPDTEGATAELALHGRFPLYDAYRHRAEVRVLRALLPAIGRGWRVLDLGCGPGRWALPLAAAGAEVCAMDYSPVMLEHARRRCEAAGVLERVTFRSGRLETLDCADRGSAFDLVLALGVIQYVPTDELANVVSRVAACVKPGGLLLHREMFAPSPFEREAVCVESGAKLISYYKSFEQYRDAFRAVGFDVVARRSILPPSIALSMLQRVFPCELNARNALGRGLYTVAIAVREGLFDPCWRCMPEFLWHVNQRRTTDLAAVLYRRGQVAHGKI